MPDTSFAFTDPRAQTVWENKLFEYSLQNMIFLGLLGKTGNSFIHVNKELLSNTKSLTLRLEADEPLRGAGVGDDGDTTGNAQQLKRRNMEITAHERATRTQSAGAVSEHLTRTNFREASRHNLGIWVKEALENDIATCAFGLYNVNSSSNDIATINEAEVSSARIYRGGQNAAGTLGNAGATYASTAALTAGTQASNLMGTKLMEAMKRRAIAFSPRFRGSMVPDLSKQTPDDIRDGVDGPQEGIFFLVLINPLQTKAIRAETGSQGWKEITAAAQIRGNKNPIFSGAAFIWDKMVFWEYDRSPTRTGAGGTGIGEGFTLNAGRTATNDAAANGRTSCRAVLLGADALSFAWAMKPGWFEHVYDANKPLIKTQMLYGVKANNFRAHGTTTDQQDEARFIIETEVIADS
jgi:hypothetical protein